MDDKEHSKQDNVSEQDEVERIIAKASDMGYANLIQTLKMAGFNGSPDDVLEGIQDILFTLSNRMGYAEYFIESNEMKEQYNEYLKRIGRDKGSPWSSPVKNGIFNRLNSE